MVKTILHAMVIELQISVQENQYGWFLKEIVTVY